MLSFSFRAFIADAPARAFILNHKGHMANFPYSKCKISGVHCKEQNNLVYPGQIAEIRTQEEYIYTYTLHSSTFILFVWG